MAPKMCPAEFARSCNAACARGDFSGDLGASDRVRREEVEGAKCEQQRAKGAPFSASSGLARRA